MNTFWLGFLVGAFISPFVILFTVWVVSTIYPIVIDGIMRKIVRRISNKYHLSLNPKRVKKPRQKLDPAIDPRSAAFGDV